MKTCLTIVNSNDKNITEEYIGYTRLILYGNSISAILKQLEEEGIPNMITGEKLIIEIEDDSATSGYPIENGECV